MRNVAVRLGERSYDIRIGEGLLADAGKILASVLPRRSLLLVSDENVYPLYGPRLKRSLRAARFRVLVSILKPGEHRKRFPAIGSLYHHLVEGKADRSTVIVALGGGVVGDLAGFAAATWHRGVPFVQIPTTLLAQVDSSVGGKTGFNLPEGKNLVGAFHQPSAVLIDPATVRTLSERQYTSGFGEVIKYGMIRSARFFSLLEKRVEPLRDRDPGELERVIERCCAIKAEYVKADERDRTGRRAHLNYGHTFGHAVESATGYRRYFHGEAVALGMVAAASLSAKRGWLTRGDRERLILLLERYGLPVGGVPVDPNLLLRESRRDKKRVGRSAGIVLTKGIGSATIPPMVADSSILRGFREICISSRDVGKKCQAGGVP